MTIDYQLSLDDLPMKSLGEYPADSIEDALKTESVGTTTEIVNVENTDQECVVELVVEEEFKTMNLPLETPAEIVIEEFGKLNREKHEKP